MLEGERKDGYSWAFVQNPLAHAILRTTIVGRTGGVVKTVRILELKSMFRNFLEIVVFPSALNRYTSAPYRF